MSIALTPIMSWRSHALPSHAVVSVPFPVAVPFLSSAAAMVPVIASNGLSESSMPEDLSYDPFQRREGWGAVRRTLMDLSTNQQSIWAIQNPTGPLSKGKHEWVTVMPVADHKRVVADLRKEIRLVSEQRDMIDAATEAALLAARQVDEAAIERAAMEISALSDGGYRRHWCSKWEDGKGGCQLCSEVARAALLAALNEPSEAVSPRKILKTVLGPIKVVPECKAQAVCVNGLKCWEAGRCLKPEDGRDDARHDPEPEEESMSEHRKESGAGDLSSWMETPHRLAVDGKGYVWRAYTDEEFWSMAPTNPDNSPIPEPITYYVPEQPDRPALNPTKEAQAETIRSLAFRFTEQEAELARLREAARDAIETWDEWPEAHRAAVNALRAVLSPESEAER